MYFITILIIDFQPRVIQPFTLEKTNP